MQFQELNDCFSEVNTDLFLYVACLCPDDSFLVFEKEKLIHLTKYYPKDFSKVDLMKLEDQLETYIIDMRSTMEFARFKGIGELE